MRLRPILLAPLVLLTASLPLEAQQRDRCWTAWEPVGGAYRDLERSISLVEGEPPVSAALRRMGRAQVRECTPLTLAAWGGRAGWSLGTPEVAVLPATLVLQNNSGYPRPQVDGLRWAGRGISGLATAGVAARWGPVSAAIAPAVAYQQNDDYAIQPVELTGHSPWGSYYHAGVIDWPQRFGDDELQWTHLGQSFVRLDAFGAAVGFSTENLQWGPVRRNPLLMSPAGPGFPHGFIGTSEPVDVWLGHLEVEAVWGRLRESEFFDTTSVNDERLLAGIVMAFTPASTGLTIGVARSYLRYWTDDLGLGDILFDPYTNVRSNPTGASAGGGDNQLLSIFFRWALPEAGFEVYGEYAREDHWHDLKDLIQEPDHERAYALGLQKLFGDTRARHRYRLAAEATILNSSWTGPYRGGGRGDFYAHSGIRQGYTHLGQPLGAPIGPGSDAQYLGFDYLGPVALGGAYFERVRYDNNVYYDIFAGTYTSAGHDAEVTVGLRGALTGAWPIPGLQLVGDIAYSSRYNRGFIGLQGGVRPTHDTNLSLSLGAAWLPASDHPR